VEIDQQKSLYGNDYLPLGLFWVSRIAETPAVFPAAREVYGDQYSHSVLLTSTEAPSSSLFLN